MPSSSENNKRIAKNTLFLYFRSILIMAVGLYTSREVLAQLGVEDFGVYNVVGGVIVLFSFVSSAMGSATSRFFTFDLGRGDLVALERTFSMSVTIHIATAGLVLLLGETVGLWFLNTQLNIPEGRMEAANWVYQFSVLSACVGIVQVPYNTAITAHERMSFFAYLGIAEAAFKLGVVLALAWIPLDKLKVYAVLVFGVFLIIVFCNFVYCRRNFVETKYRFFWDNGMFLERMGFSGLEMLGVLTTIAATQGVNMLFNIFFGVVVNAAVGIMNQVKGTLNQFMCNFFTAINPQITKSYANGDIEYFHKLILRSLKFASLLFLVFAIPLFINMDFVLSVWLKIVPNYAKVFCQIGLLTTQAWLSLMPLHVAIVSTGNNNFRKFDSVLIAITFPISYLFLKLDFLPPAVLCVYTATTALRVVYSVFVAKKRINLSIIRFAKVVGRIMLIFAISMPMPLWVTLHTEGWTALLASTACFLVIFIPSTFFLGMNKGERYFIMLNIQKKIFRKL